MSWPVFLSALIGSSLPGLFVGVYFNRSLERMKGDLQRDVFKSSKWHERRIDAVIAIYEAFDVHLDFLRQHLYWKDANGPIDQIHDFPKAVTKNIMFLDDDLAEEILKYQGQLLSFWNDTLPTMKSPVTTHAKSSIMSCQPFCPSCDGQSIKAWTHSLAMQILNTLF
jgi:hypothetical protein